MMARAAVDFPLPSAPQRTAVKPGGCAARRTNRAASPRSEAAAWQGRRAACRKIKARRKALERALDFRPFLRCGCGDEELRMGGVPGAGQQVEGLGRAGSESGGNEGTVYFFDFPL